MKRDMDVVREIMLSIEGGAINWANGNTFPECSATPDVIAYHLHIIEEAGLIDVQHKSVGSHMIFRGLTWRGHDFLDTVRDPKIWKRTKEGASKVGGAAFSTLLEIGKAVVKSELQKHGILPNG